MNEDVASAFEYVEGGDTAIASMQYSFLPSPLAFIADRETPMIAGPRTVQRGVRQVDRPARGGRDRSWLSSVRASAPTVARQHLPALRT